MAELWITRKELMKVTGWTDRTVCLQTKSGGIFARESKTRHRNGKTVLEYSTRSLSSLQQFEAEKLAELRARHQKTPLRIDTRKGDQLALFSPAAPTATPIRMPVTEAQDVLTRFRFEQISPLLDLSNKNGVPCFPALMPDGTTVRSLHAAAEWVAVRRSSIQKGKAHLSAATILRWFSDYEKYGLPGLLREKRKDKGLAGFFPRYPKAAWLAAYIYLECGQSFRVAHEAIIRDAAVIEVPPDDLPSYETVRAWLSSAPPCLVTYARLGLKAYRERMSPFLRRGYSDVYANQVWVGDHMIHDVECANDLFDDAPFGAPIRLRLSAMIDFRSRMVVGASWAWEGSSRAIAATMRRGIARFGLPEHIYVDNGKDYKKIAKGALPGYLKESPLAAADWWKTELLQIEQTGFIARLGIAVTHCIPHHPQSKHVERFFRTLHERFDKVWQTYTSGNPFTRPDQTTVAMMEHRKLLRAGRVGESDHPLASEFISCALAWIEEYNNSPHSGEGMNGATPIEVFEANLNPNQKAAPDQSLLALLMAEHERRKVRECAVTITTKNDKRRYVPTDAAGWATMHHLNDRQVVTAYDKNDREHAAVLDEDGCVLAWLQLEDLVRFAPGDKKTQDQIAESFSIRRGLEKSARETITTIARVARSNGAQTPLEAMANRIHLHSGENGTDVVTQRESHFAPKTGEPQNNLIPGQATDRLVERIRRSRETTKESASSGDEDTGVGFRQLEALG